MAAATGRRAHAPAGSGNFLAHDMSPVDPARVHVATTNPIYEPSTGQPTRQFQRNNHVAIGMDGNLAIMNEPVKTGISGHAPIPDHPQRRKVVERPGVAESAHDFFAGKHSTPATKVNPEGMRFMHENADIAKQRQMDQKRREAEYSAANWRVMQDKRQRAAEARHHRQPAAAEPSPWSQPEAAAPALIGPNDRIPHRSVASNGRMFQEGSGEGSLTAAMGKGGAGAPRRRKDGAIDTSRPAIFSKNQPFDEGPGDSYVAIHMGRDHPKRSQSGHVKAHRTFNVAKNVIHQEGSGDGFFNSVFNHPDARRTGSGSVNARRRPRMSQNQEELTAPSDPFFGPAFGSKAQPTSGRRCGLDRQLQQEAQRAPETYTDRMGKTEMAGRRQGGACRSVEQDEEFVVAMARARHQARTKPSKP